MGNKGARNQRKYLISLAERQSMLALVAGLIVFFCTMAAIIIWAESFDPTDEQPLHYFTALSNLVSAIAAAFMIPYAVEGIRKKHFMLPRYIVLFQFAAATCVAITMFTSLAIILPTQGLMAVTGYTFWLHVVTPLFALILFQCVETGTTISRRTAILCLIPFWLYIAVYYIMVVVVGKENGGWSDIYMAQAFWPAWVSVLLFLAMGFIMAMVMRAIHNLRARQFWKRVTRLWTDDTLPEEMLVEAMGLGRYIGKRFGQDEELTVPMGLFSMMSERFGLPVEKLINAYVYGALDSMSDVRQKRSSSAFKA